MDCVNWDNNEKMSKDFALASLNEIKRFYRRLYFHKEKEPFNGEADFKAACAVIDGIIDFVKDK